MNKHINKNVALKRIENKYGNKVDKLYEEYKEKNIQEFCDKLIELKQEMAKELSVLGIENK